MNILPKCSPENLFDSDIFDRGVNIEVRVRYLVPNCLERQIEHILVRILAHLRSDNDMLQNRFVTPQNPKIHSYVKGPVGKPHFHVMKKLFRFFFLKI